VCLRLRIVLREGGQPFTVRRHILVRVECRTAEDSRWYSGAGIYRDVHLIVADLVHVALNGVRVTTPDIELERAVVEIAVIVENEDLMTCTVDATVEILDGDGNAVATGTVPVTMLPGEPAMLHQRLHVKKPDTRRTGSRSPTGSCRHRDLSTTH